MHPSHHKPEFVWRENSGRRISFWPLVKWCVIAGALGTVAWVLAPNVAPILQFVVAKLSAPRPAAPKSTPPSTEPAKPAEPSAPAAPPVPPATPWAEVPAEGQPDPAATPTPPAAPSATPPATPWAEVPSAPAPAARQAPVDAEAPPPATPSGQVPSAGAEGVPHAAPQAGDPPASAAERDTSVGEPEPETSGSDSFSSPAGEARPDAPAPDPKGRKEGYWNGRDFN